MVFRKLLLYCFLLFTPLLSIANDHPHIFRHYHVNDGLSDNMVTGFFQDKNGFMWIGTRDGLNRFDGYTFKVYRGDMSNFNALNNSRITYIDHDWDENMWIGTRSGLYRYNEKKDSFNILPSTQNKNITTFQFDSENKLWRLENGNLIQHNTSDDTFKIYSREDGLSYEAFCILDDNIWVSDSQGYISLLNQEDGSLTSYSMFSDSPSDLSQRIFQLYPSKYSSEIYVVYEGDDIKVFDTSSKKYKNMNIQHTSETPVLINCILEINANEIWVGTDIGIFIYKKDNEEWIKILHDPLDQYSIASHYVARLYQDREGGIWIGYHQNGLSYYSSFNPFDVYYPKNDSKSLNGAVVHDIVSDDYGNLWIATEDAGLSSFNKATGVFTNYYSDFKQQNIAHTNLRGLAVAKDKLWVGHIIHGVDLLDVKTGKRIKNYNLFKNKDTYANSRITTMLALTNGDVLVSTPDGIYKYDEATDKFILFSDQLFGNLREDSYNNRLWIGRRYCDLNDIQASNFKRLIIPELEKSGTYNLTDIFTDKKGIMWILISERGVVRYDKENDNITWFTTLNGMPSNTVFRILPDDNENLWISTAAGLVCINTSDNSIMTYTEAHGLITRQFNYYAGYKDDDGSLYFGTVKGLIHFNPNEIDFNFTETNVFITDISIAGKEEEISYINIDNYSNNQKIKLNYDQSSFNINFSTLSYIAPRVTRYMYRMVGTSREWINIGERNVIYFTDLPPGEYTLEIQASDISGCWTNSVPLRIHIIIRPPWWASTTAYIIYILLALVAISLIVRYWVLRQKNAMAYKMQLFESTKEKELYQAKIDFFINIAHEIRTPLTLINVPLERLIKESKICERGRESLILMQKNASRLIDLVNQLLDFRRAETEGGNLTFTNVDVVPLLQATTNRFLESATEKKLTLDLDIPVKSLIVNIDKEAFTKVLSNLFTNAIKYAHSTIIVHLSLAENGETFSVEFENDGKPISEDDQQRIFVPFYRISNDALNTGTGLGLPLTRFLVEKHNGTIRVSESNEERTIFSVSIPTKQQKIISHVVQEIPLSMDIAVSNYPQEINRSTVLVVDDNEEMRILISSELNNYYNVLTAENGEKALQILGKNNIKLIISDILMPVMDGFELLKEVKTNLEYSHIPVVLLTAKTTIQARLEGLELGADAYIDKPFSMDILLAQTSNLLTNRESIRQFYFKSPIANMKSMAYSKADEEFLENLNTIINEHLSDPTFDVNSIASMLFMSRPTLYRKINAISHLTPHDLIKIARLKKSAELLIQGELKIYEISELVGFSSQSYFWTAFIKQFGMSPSKYAKANKFK